MENARNGHEDVPRLHEPVARPRRPRGAAAGDRAFANRCAKPPDSARATTRPPSPYVIVPLSSDYRSQRRTLNASSDLVSTIDCVQANGSTAYANAIDAAQAELDAQAGRATQKVIVFLSDGAANTGPLYYPASSPYLDARRATRGSRRRRRPRRPARPSSRSATTSRTTAARARRRPRRTGRRSRRWLTEQPRPRRTHFPSRQPPVGLLREARHPGQLNQIFTSIAADLLRNVAAPSTTTPSARQSSRDTPSGAARSHPPVAGSDTERVRGEREEAADPQKGRPFPRCPVVLPLRMLLPRDDCRSHCRQAAEIDAGPTGRHGLNLRNSVGLFGAGIPPWTVCRAQRAAGLVASGRPSSHSGRATSSSDKTVGGNVEHMRRRDRRRRQAERPQA